MKKQKKIKLIIGIEIVVLVVLLCVAFFLFGVNDVKEPEDQGQTTEGTAEMETTDGTTVPDTDRPTDNTTDSAVDDPIETDPTDDTTEKAEDGTTESTTASSGPVNEWNKPGKLPNEYTWEEYQTLSLAEREAFFLWFESEAAFEAWKERVKPTDPTTPDTGWNKPGKLPGEYTWEEYQVLSLEDQEAFFLWFESEASFEAWKERVKPTETTVPDTEWNKPGKLPEEYTWDEYLALSLEEREAFFLWFDSEAAFEAWMEGVKPTEPTIPDTGWNKPGKLPSEYTWAEYQALNMEEREAFFLWFESEASFEAWKERVKPTESIAPDTDWDKPGKLPNEYTWEEYKALSPEEQDAFFLWFESEVSFEAWKERVKPTEPTIPDTGWDKPGKLPNEYTWEEYQALSPEEQDDFFLWFASVEAFEAWMNRVKPVESTAPAGEWNKPGKLPNEYTWEEYQTLSLEEQDAFFLWFESETAFEAWMERVKPEESTAPSGVWDKPGKQPDEYTWEEYQALTPEEQDAFFLWFGSVEAFEAWMNHVKPTESTAPAGEWNKPGKLPNEYTWEEYLALTPEEQDAFFLWFESVDAFESWMDAALEG